MARRYNYKKNGSWIGFAIVIAIIIYIIKLLFPLLVIAGIAAAGYGIYYYSKCKARGGIAFSSLALILCLALSGYVFGGHSNGNHQAKMTNNTSTTTY